MKAVFIKEFGGIENLEIREVENPLPPVGNEVLVSVKASAINRADILQRKGLYPAPKDCSNEIPGLEFAGEVVEKGANVKSLSVGDRVFGIAAGGAQAELVLSDKSLLVKIPANLSFTEAAAIPEAFITAYDAIFTIGKLKKGETLLIHAVGSGVGLAALQLAKAKKIKVIGTSRNFHKLEKCRNFGLDYGILMNVDLNHNPKYFADLIQYYAPEQGVDVILDLVGGGYFQANLECLNSRGRLILVGLTAGAKAEFNLGTALRKRLCITGTVLRSRSVREKSEATKKFAKDVIPLLRTGRIRPNIDRIYKLADIGKAHEYLESNESFGKVVLEF